jgi:transposase
MKASLLRVLYSVRSELQFRELLEYDLLFKWFLDLKSWASVSTTHCSPRISSGD